MLKEIDNWVKLKAIAPNQQTNSINSMINSFGAATGANAAINSLRKTANQNLIDFDGGVDDSQEDQIAASTHIHENLINYLKTFQIVCAKLINLFNSFNAPNLIWKMVNYLSLILEKNTDDTDKLIECLN